MLRAKVEALVEPDSGIFGPLAPTEPGEERKPLEGDAEGAGPPTFTSVSRGLGKEDVGSGHGLSAQIQIGQSPPCLLTKSALCRHCLVANHTAVPG